LDELRKTFERTFHRNGFPAIILIRHFSEKPPRKRASTIRQRVKIVGLGLAAALMFGLPANADQRYNVSGNDRYQIGQTDLQTSIAYSGTQRLSITKDGMQRRFTAQATYTRSDSAGKVPAQASFVQEMTPQGELKDRMDLDPDYLTVLNQPFAVELDTATLHDLLHLRGRVPFVFPAPMTGGTLRGYLQRGQTGRIGSRPVVAVNFDATGPMAGPLPDHGQMSISGSMRMRGTAYYALRGEPLLLALNETLTINGTLHDREQTSPVKIQYWRSIRADDSQASETTAAH
jgi:hypothetical protein